MQTLDISHALRGKDLQDMYMHVAHYIYAQVVTWARGVCLICMPGPRAVGMHIRQIPSAHVTTDM